ncbi:MAG TPA: urease accessory protein UreE [Geminicoccaceae bacterium]
MAPLRLERIVGEAGDPALAERLHALAHAGAVESIVLGREDAARHRLRAVTDRGRECAIALPRSQRLRNGAVLLLEADRAIVVRLREEEWLALRPRDLAAALELGHFAGNMHWRIRIEGARLKIALEAPEADYLDRLAPLIADGRIARDV